jgi:hypothetical protein
MGSCMTSVPYPELTWDHIVEARREDVGLTPIEIEKAALALAHLRSVFGEDVSTLPELLLQFLTNRAPWTYQWIVWLSCCLHRLAPVDGYEKVVRRLRHRKEFCEALSVIEVADRAEAQQCREGS